MKKIVILTNNFPYTPGENTFILPEIEELKKTYKIEILCVGADKEQKGFKERFDLKDIKISRMPNKIITKKEKIRNFIKCIFSLDYYKNILSSKCSLKTFINRESECRNFYLYSNIIYNYMKDKGYFDKSKINSTIFYSFWSNSNLLALCMEKSKNKDIKIVARANGYDLYNERMKGLHQPYKNFMDKYVDAQLFDADLNRKYYIDHFAKDKLSDKYILAYLGIQDRGIEKFKKENIIRIVSCSNLIPLKRVNLIIEELSLIKDIPIEWVHFGSGPLMKCLQEQAINNLNSNIKYEFKGYVDNKDIVKYYQNNSIDLFIHLSETEGCPVSLSEAASFGIPIVATDAGGVREIVSDSIGKLIPVDFKKGTVAKFIKKYYEFDKETVKKYRKNARNIFLEKFNAKNNSKRLVELMDNQFKIKICHVTSSHDRYDGRIFQKECTSLAKKYNVTLLCSDLFPNEIKNEVKIVSVGIDNKNRKNRFFLIPKKMKKECKRIDAAIYHFHDPELLTLAKYIKKKRKKVIFDSHEDNVARIDNREWIPNIVKPIVKKVFSLKEKNVFRRIDSIITVTDSIYQRIMKINKNTYIITNYPILINKYNQLKKSDNRLCFAGTFGKQYMHHNIIKALDGLDVVYTIAGKENNNYLNKLRKLKNFKKVIYLGQISKDECYKLYSKSNIGMVLIDYVPNINYKHGSMGITKIFEYMEAGIPVIATDLDVWMPFVHNKCGICVNPNNIEEIYSAIKYLVDNPKEAKKMGENGRKLIENNYNWDQQEKVLYAIYEKIIKKSA